MRSVGNFAYLVDKDTPYDIINIWSADLEVLKITNVIDEREIYTVSVFLESLRLDVYLPSFDKTPFPDIYPEDSVAERNRKLMEVQQNAPKTGLAFYRKHENNSSWVYLSEVVLQNRGRRTQIPVIVPYFTTNQLKILNKDTAIAIQKIDYGDGVIGEGPIIANQELDRIQIEGDYRIDVDQTELKRRSRVSEQRTITVRTNDIFILNQNANRAFFEIQNNGEIDLYISFGGDPNSAPYIIKPHQTYYPQTPVITTQISASVPSNETVVTVIEFEYY